MLPAVAGQPLPFVLLPLQSPVLQAHLYPLQSPAMILEFQTHSLYLVQVEGEQSEVLKVAETNRELLQ